MFEKMEPNIVKFLFVSAAWSMFLLSRTALSDIYNTELPSLIGFNQSCSYDYQCETGNCSNSICACSYQTTYSPYTAACASDCNSTVTETTGTIRSPDYPPGSTTYCTWTIEGSYSTIIAFTITYMDMGTDDSCAADSIEIFDGPSTSYRTFGKMCTSWQTLTLSTTNYMHVVFKTSGSGSLFATFKNLYTQITLSESTGFISSPGYPLGYLNDMSYNWTIQGGVSTYIVLKFISFELERTFPICSYDYVQIFDGNNNTSPLLYTLCDALVPNSIVSTSNSMYIVFKTDVSKTRKGFYATFSSHDCYIYLNAPSGIFSSPGYPNSYNKDSTCIWKISLYAGSRIFLSFTDFEVLPCDAAFVAVYDGESPRAVLNVQLCGKVPQFSLTSSSNFVFIAFITAGLSSSVTYRGFNISYTIKDLPYAEKCSVVDQCLNNLTCVNSYCNCTSDTFFNNSTLSCHPKIGFKENCIETLQCKSNLQCINGTCSCYQDYYYSQIDVMCKPVLDHSLNCYVTAMCNSSKYLDCLPDFNGTQRCLCIEKFNFEDKTCVSSSKYIVQRPQAKNKNTTGVELQWEAITLGPNRTYGVSWVSASDETDRGTQAANESGVTVTGLTPGTSYTITVYTFLQQQGLYTDRNVSTIVNIVTYPAKPGLVNTTSSKLDKPPYIIRFQPSEGRVDHYMFSFESKLQLPEYTVISPEVELSGLQADTEYRYSIKAVNFVGDESVEVEGSFKTAKSVCELNTGAIIGTTVGSLVFLVVVTVIVFIIIKRWVANSSSVEERHLSKFPEDPIFLDTKLPHSNDFTPESDNQEVMYENLETTNAEISTANTDESQQDYANIASKL